MMSMVINDEQGMLQIAAKEFFRANLPVNAFRSSRDENNQVRYDTDAWRQMIEMGWGSILLPETLDGLDFGIKGMGLIAIEAAHCLAVTPLQSAATLCVDALLAADQSAARDKLLRDIAAGCAVPTFKLTEAETCQLRKESDNLTISGSLEFVPEAMAADSILLLIEGHDSDTQLDSDTRLVRIDLMQEGVLRKPVCLIDRRDYASVQLNEVAVDSENCFKLHDSSHSNQVQAINDRGALMTACELFGISQETFTRTLEYLKEREQFGQKIGAFQALQHRMAKAYMQIELFKSVLYDALDAVEQGREDATLAVSHAKIIANDVSQLVCREAIQMHGGMGITDELDIGLFYKRARVLRTVFGSTSFHKHRFARLSGY